MRRNTGLRDGCCNLCESQFLTPINTGETVLPYICHMGGTDQWG